MRTSHRFLLIYSFKHHSHTHYTELWRMLMKGGNDLSPIVQANRLLGPMLLILYQVVKCLDVSSFFCLYL